MKFNFTVFILFIFSYIVFANDNDLLNEYKLLYSDISNVKTVSYKSYFNNEYNMAFENINVSQGALFITEVPSNIAIVGEGYFKIRLENDLVGWTRAGFFLFDSNGNVIVNKRYFLYDNINFQGVYIPQTLKITNDGNIYISIIEEKDNIVEIYAGKLLIYNIPSELLVRFSDIIYVIKDDAKYNEELSDSNVFQCALETSNVPLLPVILRMFYILSVINENYISNIELKKELLRIQIERIANNYLLDENLDYLYSILPYLKYDF